MISKDDLIRKRGVVLERKEILQVGQSASFTKTISESDVYSYAGITGDFNPLHVNDEYVKDSGFKKRIVHGMLIGGLISTVLGTKLPGEGTIYIEQDLNFLKAAFIGDTCTATVVVDKIINVEKGIYRLTTYVSNQFSERIADGYAVIKYI